MATSNSANLVGYYLPIGSFNRIPSRTTFRKLDFLASPMNNSRLRIQDYVNTYTQLLITENYKFSPDLIADDAYGDPVLWWVICRYNGIVNVFDPINGIVPGNVILVPNASDVKAWLKLLVASTTQNNLVTV